ncbi:hypothetical protein EW146_g1572 [Bondarzewia mesenterica]|uniref:mRNA-decapping enzyme C-terminal domain-containing protein n=1 Tax=Bondarzewia mesenterica TaxID=1095465 RepID=A0A4S4M3F5_9AGAM|nr:hypothetical protein EW146_g1572 [Bondarzewia mesenterica]
MKPRPPRPTSTTNPTNNVSPSQQRIRQQRPLSQSHNQSPKPASAVVASKPSPGLGMSATSRYNQNLKVLRRHDPSIVSIFDQFSHVCLYHHNGTKWEKKGFEGSMFLFERNAYPPHGLYILNRMGMEDYVLLMYPEDDVESHGEYLMYRSYPDFTTKRLAMGRPFPNSIPSANSSPEFHPPAKTNPAPQNVPPLTGTPSDYADARGREPTATDVLTNWQVLLAKSPDKGKSETVGLWMFATDRREPMKDVMKRLHSYIHKVVSYPEEFRYGPNRLPPPPSTKTSGGTSSASEAESDACQIATVSASGNLAQPAATQTSQSKGPAFNGGMSDLDKLFSKLVPASNTSTISTPTTAPSSKVTLSDLFASASTPSSTTAKPSSPSPTAASATKGLALLDSIFASATPSPPALPPYSHPNPQLIHNSSASPFPAPPSAPPSTKLSFAEAQFEADYPSDTSPGHTYALSSQYEIHSPKPTSSALPQILTQDVISSLLGIPIQPSPTSRTSSATSSRHSGSQQRYEGDIESISDDVHSIASASVGEYSESSTEAHVLGDVTPRPPLRGFGTGDATPLAPRAASPRSGTFSPPASIAPSSSTSTVLGPSQSQSQQTQVRTASPVTSSQPQPNGKPTGHPLIPFQSDSDLWPYPRAPLDDRDRHEYGYGSDDADVVELDFADTSALSDMDAFNRRQREREAMSGKERGKGKGKERKGRKERERENEREREEIEKSWDVPERMAPAPPAPVPAPVVAPTPAPVRVPVNGVKENGKSKGKTVVNGASASAIDHGAAKAAVLAAVNGKALAGLGRNDFVREILTLIHTDKGFVDSLWGDYLQRTS